LRRIGNVCVESGYKVITLAEIGNCVHALNRREISYRAVRVYFACLALVAIREAAKRSASRARRKPHEMPRYGVSEISTLTGLAEKSVLRELRALRQVGMLFFSESSITTQAEPRPESAAVTQLLAGSRSCKRPLPVPRSVLRFLARSHKVALGKTVLAYLARGMTIDRNTGEVRGVGTVKASWISEVMEVSLRAVKAARKELIALGLVSKDTGSVQRKLNRDGAYFRVSLAWKGGTHSVTVARPCVLVRAGEPAVTPGIAPQETQTRPAFAPPIKEKRTPYGSKDQRAWRAKPGVSPKQGREGNPCLRNVRIEDLMAFSRTEALYRQAVSASWIHDSEASFLNWVGAAVRAKTCRAGDPVRVFLGIVKRGLWSHITDADEERARLAINRYRHGASESVGRAGPSILTDKLGLVISAG